MSIFPFLQLPRELRDQIYYFCLVNHYDPHRRFGPIETRCSLKNRRRVFAPPTSIYNVDDQSHQSPWADNHIPSHVGLLQTNLQIYKEAASYLYEDNNFCFTVYSARCELRPFHPLVAKVSSMTILDLDILFGKEHIDEISCKLNRLQSPLKRLDIEIDGATFLEFFLSGFNKSCMPNLEYVAIEAIRLAQEVRLFLVLRSAENSRKIASKLSYVVDGMGCELSVVDPLSLDEGEARFTCWSIKKRSAHDAGGRAETTR